ncbi:MAG: MFS transporter [Candidatus Limnocylindria bacterium]
MSGTSVGASVPPANGLTRIFRPLADRDFRLLFSGETISLLGDQFHFVALAWLVLQMTGSGLAVGTVLMVAGIPRAIFILVGGAFADRASPRTVMLASNGLRAAFVGVLAFLVLSGGAELWQLYVLAAIFGIVDAFFWPALNTIVPMLVAEERLPAANALMQGSTQLTGLIGPALAGLLIAAVGTGLAFGIDAASFGVAALALVLIRGGRRPAAAEASRPNVLGTIGSGVAYAWRDPAVRSLILLSAALNFAINGPISVGLAWLADNRFDGGAASFGIMLSAFGAGALVGAVVAGSMGRIRELGWVTLGGSVVMGVGLGLIGFAPSVVVIMGLNVAIGLAVGFLNVRIVAWLQARTPEAMIGRVMSLVMLGGLALSPLSLAIAGLLVDIGAATLCFAVAGALVVVAALAGVGWGVPSQMREA